jgi:hypothetical protein
MYRHSTVIAAMTVTFHMLCILFLMNIQLPDTIHGDIQWKPLIIITLGLALFDNNNQLITLSERCKNLQYSIAQHLVTSTSYTQSLRMGPSRGIYGGIGATEVNRCHTVPQFLITVTLLAHTHTHMKS